MRAAGGAHSPIRRLHRHCERSEAIYPSTDALPDCFARASAVRAISEHLHQYARSKGGRFPLSGSTARGETGFDSDIDLLLDFPAHLEADAAVRGIGHNAGNGARMSKARWIEVSAFTRLFRNPACMRNNRFCPIDEITLRPRWSATRHACEHMSRYRSESLTHVVMQRRVSSLTRLLRSRPLPPGAR